MLMYSVDVISVACSKQGSVIWVDSRQSEEHSYTHACTYVITYSKNARTFVYKEARLIARLLYKKKYVGVSILHKKCVCMYVCVRLQKLFPLVHSKIHATEVRCARTHVHACIRSSTYRHECRFVCICLHMSFSQPLGTCDLLVY